MSAGTKKLTPRANFEGSQFRGPHSGESLARGVVSSGAK